MVLCMGAFAKVRQEGDSNRRNVGRAVLSFPSKLALSEGNFSCVLEDISLGGARISCDRKIESGRELWLKFDRFNIFGTISWSHGREYGIEFEERIPKAIILEIQGCASDLETYEEHQGMVAAKAYVLGEGRVLRSPLMRLLDVVSPITREEFSECPQCDRGDVCSTHCGQKRFKRSQLLRVLFYLGLAVLTGTVIGIGSLMLE